MNRSSRSLVLILISSLSLFFLGVSSFVLPLWNARDLDNHENLGVPTIRLENLVWYAHEGFSSSDRAGFGPSAPGVIAIRQFPVPLNLLFNIPTGDSVRRYSLMTSFWLDTVSSQQSLMMNLAEVGDNWAVYLNGVEIYSAISMDADGQILLHHSMQNVEVLLPSGNLRTGNNTLVFFIAGNAPVTTLFNSWLPGFSMARGYLLGPVDELQRSHMLGDSISWFLIGIYFFLGMSHLYQFMRQKEIYLIYFGLFLLTCATYTFTISRVAFEFFPDTSFLIRSMYATNLSWPALVGLTIQNFLLPASRTPRGLRLIIAMLAIGTAIVYLIPAPWFEPVMAVLIPLIGISMIYLAWRVFQANRRKLPNARPIFIAGIGILALAFWTIIDIEFVRSGIDVIQLFPSFLAIAFSAIFIDRLWRMKNNLAESNRQLQLAYDNVEAQISERTAELRNMNSRLEEQIVENNALQDKLREMATHDALTGLYNRHYLDETLMREFARAQREHGKISLVMFDLDHFKGLNDRFGHHNGDIVLQEFAVMLSTFFRLSDIPFRYGGEEFLMVLPVMDREKAWQRTENFRNLYSQKVYKIEGQEVNVTFSAGVAEFPFDGESPRSLLKRADAALYLAKAHGRNRVELAVCEFADDINPGITMKSIFYNFYNPIIHPNHPDMQRRALIAHQLQVTLSLVLITTALIGIGFFFQNKLLPTLFLVTALVVIGFTTYLNRKGHLYAAAIITCAMILIISILMMLVSGGLKSLDILFLLPGVAIAGLILGAAATWIYIGLCVVSTFGIFLAENAGIIFPNLLTLPSESIFIIFCISLLLIGFPLTKTLNSLDKALKLASQNEQRYRSLLENIPAITYISATGPGQPTIYISPQTLDLTGYSQAEFLTNSLLSAGLTDPDDHQMIAAKLARIDEETTSVQSEYRIHARDGRIVWIRDEAVRFRDPQTQSNNWLGVWSDITLRRQAEVQLSELNATLEEQVSERTHLLEEAYKELESFSYSVSHDLRAPLRAIRSYSAILADEFDEKLDTEARELIAKVVRSGTEMNEKIDGLLALSRVSNIPLTCMTFNISNMVEEVLGSLRDSEPNRLMECSVQSGVIVTGDPILIRTLLENLLGNAWKYTGKTQLPHIKFSAEKNSDSLICCVQDNGAGFNMDYIDKLFGTFQRLHGNDEFPGHGIGLATVKRIIRRHGGRIWAQAELGKGAKFYFTLGLFLGGKQSD